MDQEKIDKALKQLPVLLSELKQLQNKWLDEGVYFEAIVCALSCAYMNTAAAGFSDPTLTKILLDSAHWQVQKALGLLDPQEETDK